MTALTENVARTLCETPRRRQYPVRALNQAGNPIKIKKGSLCCKRIGSNLVEIPEPLFPRTDLICVGVSDCEIDMTGLADGDLQTSVEARGWRDFATGSGANEITADNIDEIAYMYDDNTLYLTSNGGTLSPAGTVMLDDLDGTVGWALYVELESAAITQAVAANAATVANSGTATLVAGVATIAATVTAASRILVTMKDPGAGAITGFASFSVPVADRVVGAPGSFKVYAIDDTKATIATAVCTIDWKVEG